jgi:AcrR family transcriptional regulator
VTEDAPSTAGRRKARRTDRDQRREREGSRSRRKGNEAEGDSRSRRTQAERTAETTERILDATVACLAELGHAGTSTSEICRRAGVSRGALLHHYRTKQELLAAAVTHVFQQGVAEFRERIVDIEPGPARLDAAVDLLWQIFRTDTFDAWLELIVAGRTDHALQRHVARETERLATEVTRAWADLFPAEAGRHDPSAVMAPLVLFAMLEGLALNRHTGATFIEDAAPEVLATLKTLGHTLLTATEPDTTTGGAP